MISAMDFSAIALQSGSSGNCIYVETGGIKLLFDAGITGREAEARLAACSRDIRMVDALIISHDHGDHIRFAGIYQRKFGMPVYITEKTYEAAVKRHRLGKLQDIRFFRSDGFLQFGAVSVQAISTPHDATDGAAFIVSSAEKRLGIMTDLGHVFEGLGDFVNSLDAVFIESNYDPDMLEHGRYPAFLKKRIMGPKGHLSNIEAAELIKAAADKRLRWACLSHLSGQNNSPSVALKTHRNVLREMKLDLYVADRSSGTPPITL